MYTLLNYHWSSIFNFTCSLLDNDFLICDKDINVLEQERKLYITVSYFFQILERNNVCIDWYVWQRSWRFWTRNKCIAIDILVIYKIFLPCSPKGEFSWGWRRQIGKRLIWWEFKLCLVIWMHWKWKLYCSRSINNFN